MAHPLIRKPYLDLYRLRRVLFYKSGVPEADSYENLDQMELTQAPLMEDTLSDLPIRRSSMKKLVRQASTLETQRDIDGTLKMTYWF